MDDTALAPRGLARGTVGKLAGMVRIRSIGLIGSQVLTTVSRENAVHRLNGGGRICATNQALVCVGNLLPGNGSA